MNELNPRRWTAFIPWVVLSALTVAPIVFLLSYEECDARCSDWDFVNDLVLSDERNGQVYRWETPASVGVDRGTPLETRIVQSAVDELNDILSDTDFQLRFVAQQEADISIVFVSNAELEALAREDGLDGSHALGFFIPYVTENGVIKAAEIVVSTNLEDAEKWGTILHELVHALGFFGHTDRYFSSLFYEDFKGGPLSDGLSADDRKLLVFLYQHLRPGEPAAVVQETFDRYWALKDR